MTIATTKRPTGRRVIQGAPQLRQAPSDGVQAAADTGVIADQPIRILRLAQVIQMTGLRKTTLYELQSQGVFPLRIKITNHSVGWLEQDVQSWVKRRIALSAACDIRRT